MRWYEITIEGAAGGGNLLYTSMVDGKNNPGALDIEFDIQEATASALTQAGWLRIWGVPLKTISQASDLNGATVTIAAGFSGGLPLENASQKGVIALGQVFQAFGNWVGTDMTLELIFYSLGHATQSQPVNLAFVWKKGTQLGDGIQAILQTAFPGATITMQISKSLALPEDTPGAYQTLEQFGPAMTTQSKQLNTSPTYAGVQITVGPDGAILVFDGTVPASQTVDIKFQELIGQPTWIDVDTLQLACPMRSDITINSELTMPKTQVTQSSAEQAQQDRDKSSFSGKFNATLIQHKGKFRDPGPMSWATIINAVGQNAPAAQEPQSQG